MELLDKTQLNKGTLYRHLGELESGGIVANYYQKLADTRVYSFYELTPFGLSILSSLVRIVRGKGVESRPSWTFGQIEPAFNAFDPDELPTSKRGFTDQVRAGSSAFDGQIRGGAGDSQRATGTVGGTDENL